MSAEQPVVAALTLAKALLEGDEVTARKVVTKSAWKAAVGPVWEQLAAAGWHLSVEPTAKALGGRAVVRAEVLDAAGTGRGWRYVLLGKRRHAWRVDAITASGRHAYVFLDGRLPAIPRFSQSAEGRAFVEELVATLATDKGEPLPVQLPADHPYTRILDDLRGQVLRHGRTPSVAGVKALSELERVLVGIRFEGAGEPLERWLVLGRNEIAPRLVLLIDAAGPDDLDALLTDLEPEWAELETPMADDKKKLTPEEAKDLVNQVVTQAMKEMGYEQTGGTPDFSGVSEGDLKGKIPELVYNLLQSAISEQTGASAGEAAAGKGSEPAVAPTEAAQPEVVDLQAERQRREPREPSEFERNISASLSGAVSGYMADNVVGEGEDEVKVDADFLKDHGPKLFANLFGAFVKSIVPEDMKIDVPVTTTDEGGTRQVNMKLDVGEMIGKVLEPVERAAKKQAGKAEPADESEDAD